MGNSTRTRTQVFNKVINMRHLSTVALFTVALVFASCTKPTESGPEAPTVVTSAITQVTSHTAMVGGDVTSAGDSPVTDRGVCIFTTPSPTPSDICTSAGDGIGSFTVSITGLDDKRSYSVRAYATSAVGTSYGDQLSFATLPITVTDVDGNTYATIKIGTQLWMQENLKTTRYANGDTIPNVTIYNDWRNLSTGAWMQGANNTVYGKMYNWYAVANAAGLCPTGWHVPSKEEWTVLTDLFGGHIVAGGSLKSTGTSAAGTGLWSSPNSGATNESGFTGLPGGQRGVSESPPSPISTGDQGNWWSSTLDERLMAWGPFLVSNNRRVDSFYYNPRMGKSVRCLRD